MDKLYIIFIVLLVIANYSANAQELPEEELQVNISSYFDNFNVNVVYPDVSVKKSLSETTGINGRFLVDVMSCASMKSIKMSIQLNMSRPITMILTLTLPRQKISTGAETTFPTTTDLKVLLGLHISSAIGLCL